MSEIATIAGEPGLELLERAAELLAAVQAEAAGAAVELEAWLAHDAAHRLAYAELLAVWHGLECFERHETPPLAVTVTAPPVVRLPTARRAASAARARPRRAALTALAATLVAAAVLALAPRGDFRTAPGGRETLTLDDGTVLELATDTAIDVRYTPERRRVVLRRGAVYAAVAHDTARPFEIDAGDVQAVAVGTEYAVERWAGEAVVVTMAVGTVETVAAGRSRRIVAGERYAPATATSYPDAEAGLAWRRDQLVLSDAPLEVALARLDRYLAGHVQCLGRCDERVSAVLPVGDARAALRSLAAQHGYRVRELPYLVLIER